MSTNTDLQSEVTLLSSKLDNMTKTIRILNSGSDTLDEILLVEKKYWKCQRNRVQLQKSEQARKNPCH